MHPNFTTPKDPELKQLINKLNVIFSKINSDNMQTRLMGGVTASVANTELLLKHNLSTTPQFYLPISGDFYIETLGPDTVDVRSSQTSAPFKFLLVV